MYKIYKSKLIFLEKRKKKIIIFNCLITTNQNKNVSNHSKKRKK